MTVHRLALARRDIEVRDGVARTRPAATMLGLAAVVPPAQLERALDDALLKGLLSCVQLKRRLDAGSRHGRNGVAVLRPCWRHGPALRGGRKASSSAGSFACCAPPACPCPFAV